MDLSIARSNGAPRRGDFGAKVQNGQLLLPGTVVDLAAGQGVRSALELLSWLEAFPSAVAEQMQWSATDVNEAKGRIEALVRRYVDPVGLGPRGPRRVRVYGARHPRGEL